MRANRERKVGGKRGERGAGRGNWHGNEDCNVLFKVQKIEIQIPLLIMVFTLFLGFLEKKHH